MESRQHRGYAFVEFVSIDEAKIAFEKIQNVHFYGRKFVLEYSHTVEDLN